MKNIFLKTLGGAFAIVALAAFVQIFVSAQDNDGGYKGARGLEGVWDVQVTARNCQTGEAIRTFPAMQTFAQGGTLSDWGSGNPPSRRGAGMGVWSHVSGQTFASSFEFFIFNADGTLAGKQMSRGQIELSLDGESYTSSRVAQILDVNGNLTATNCSTSTSTRFE
jgi:hypothetical protein